MDELTENLATELSEFSIDAQADVLLKMKEFCQVYAFSPDDMVRSWIAFSTMKFGDMEPTLDALAQFEKEELMKAVKNVKHNKQRKSMTYASSDMDISNDDCYELLEQKTPDNRKKKYVTSSPSILFSPNSFSPVRSTPSAKYSSRNAPGTVVISYQSSQDTNWKCDDILSCTISAYNKETAVEERFYYMFEKFREYASVLNDLIENMAVHLQTKYNVSEWAPVHLSSAEEVPVVGRICSDGSTKLNSLSLMLEGSRETSSGHMINLDVSQLEQFSLFPGQIIGGEGSNNLGKKLILKKIYEPDLLPFPEDPPEIGSNSNDFLSVVIAAGPFTTTDSLSYEPLEDLTKYIKANKPHVCILCGPLVDTKHNSLELGNFSESYHDIFQGLVSSIMSGIDGTSTKIILVPSVRDVHHDPIYPTPPFQIKQNFKNLYLASDPCLLKFNGVVFGITSTDILLHLGKEEINFPPQSSDRLGRLCSHILTQKNFYPLYPPAEGMSIDYVHFESHCLLSVTPHVLILPSELRCFIKNVNGCCCINPEKLTKHSVGGTFARLKIKHIDPSTYSGSIIDYMQADIVKI